MAMIGVSPNYLSMPVHQRNQPIRMRIIDVTLTYVVQWKEIPLPAILTLEIIIILLSGVEKQCLK